MTNEELSPLQIRDPELLIGKTIKAVHDGDEYADVVIVFTDGTFVIVDHDPEGCGVGFCLDSWHLRSEEYRGYLSRILTQ